MAELYVHKLAKTFYLLIPWTHGYDYKYSTIYKLLLCTKSLDAFVYSVTLLKMSYVSYYNRFVLFLWFPKMCIYIQCPAIPVVT